MLWCGQIALFSYCPFVSRVRKGHAAPSMMWWYSECVTFFKIWGLHFCSGPHKFWGFCKSIWTIGSISTECLYFGKVTDFIDGILLDRPDSYNRVLVNCLYGHGMVQLVLTTLVAASQLLFTVDKAPAPPMETDDGNSKPDGKDEIDHS